MAMRVDTRIPFLARVAPTFQWGTIAERPGGLVLILTLSSSSLRTPSFLSDPVHYDRGVQNRL